MRQNPLKFALLVSFCCLGFVIYAQKPLTCQQAFLDLEKPVRDLILLGQLGSIKDLENLKNKEIDEAFIFVAQNRHIPALESLKHLASLQALYTAYSTAIKYRHQTVINSLKPLVSQALVKRIIQLANRENLTNSIFVYIHKIDSKKYDSITVFVESALFEGTSFLEFIFTKELVSPKDTRDIFAQLIPSGEIELLKTIINKKNSHIKTRGHYLQSLVKGLQNNHFEKNTYNELLDLVNMLMDKGVDPISKDKALQLVNKTGHTILKQILIKNGANSIVNKEDTDFNDNKNQPDYNTNGDNKSFVSEINNFRLEFINLVRKGQIKELEKRILNNVFMTQAIKEKAFFEAIKSRQTRVVEFLSSYVITQPKSYSPIIYKALRLSILMNYVAVYEILIDAMGYHIKSLNKRGELLVLATQRRDENLIKALIKKEIRQIAIHQAILLASEQGYTLGLKILIKRLKNSVNDPSLKEDITFLNKDSLKVLKQARLKAQQNKHYQALRVLNPYIKKLITSLQE